MKIAIDNQPRVLDYTHTENKYKKSKPLKMQKTVERVIELVVQVFLAFAFCYLIFTTVRTGKSKDWKPSEANVGKVSAGDKCILAEERCREQYLKENLQGLTNFRDREKHPRYKFEYIIASIKCSEHYILNLTQCHSPGEELFHEDYYCTQKNVKEIKDDAKAFKYLTQHCATYNFRIRSEEIEDSNELREI